MKFVQQRKSWLCFMACLMGNGIAWLSTVSPAIAQPITPAADGTQTIVTHEGNRIDIGGGTLSGDKTNLFHSFEQFGLSEGQMANFLTNPEIQNILGRVVGGDPSVINGLIQVSGGNSNLFLMNPAGIVFGSGASLNVPAAFTATTATGIGFGGEWFKAYGTNNYHDLAANPDAFRFDSPQAGAIVNAGDLTVEQGENLSLVAGTVVNTGTLRSPGGNITVMALPGTGLVRLKGDGQILSLDLALPADGQGDSLLVTPLMLPELLTGSEVETGLTVNGDRIIQTNGIILPTQAGTAIISGTLDASNPAARQVGGTVNVLGNQVGLFNANINASGARGGGTVLLGGDYQGQGTLPNASSTYVSSDSRINANARRNGEGGRVIVWADEATRVYGNITARGGLNSGDGGFVETSSRQFLDIATTPDVTAAAGLGGTWLIDPKNIEIVEGFGSDKINTPNPFSSNGDGAILGVGLILQALTGGANVEITTGDAGTEAGDITLSTPLDFEGTGENTLRLEAYKDININAPIFDSVPGADLLNLAFFTDIDGNDTGAVNVNASIETGGGNVEFFTHDTNISTGGSITSGTGAIAINGINFINEGNVTSGTGTIRVTGDEDNFINFSNVGNVISATGAITVGVDNFSNEGNITSGTGAISIEGKTIDEIPTDGINFINEGNVTSGTGAITVSGNNFINVGNVTSSMETITIRGDNFSNQGNIESTNGSIDVKVVGQLINGVDATIRSTSGSIFLGSDSTALNSGTITSSSGAVTLEATESFANTAEGTIATVNSPISIEAQNVRTAGEIDSINGAITLQADAIVTAGDSTITTTSGAITLNADAITTNAGNSIKTTTGAIALNADSFNLDPTSVVDAGSSDITLKTDAITIALNDINGILSLTTEELATFQTTGTVIIGRPGDTGSINIGSLGAIDLSNETFNLILYGGDVTFSNGFTLPDNKTLTFNTGAIASAPSGIDISIGGTSGKVVLNTTGSVGTAANPLSTAIAQVTAPNVAGNLFLSNNQTLDLGTSTVTSDLGIQTTTGDLNDSGIITVGGNSNFSSTQSNADINLDQLNVAGAIGLATVGATGNATIINATGLTLTPTTIEGNLTASATTGNITAQDITARGGITLTTTGNIEASLLDSSSLSGQAGGAINLSSSDGAISTGNITSSGTTGGEINLSSSDGIISTGNITSSGITAGGEINLNAKESITTGVINSSGSSGDGGDVTLDPSGDIQVSSINAQGGNLGEGGDVDITTNQFFRATDTFITSNGSTASISTIGGNGGGNITIRHGGGGVIPFAVGDATTNGTAGAITRGESAIAPLQSFRFTEISEDGNIQIISVDDPNPPVPPDNPVINFVDLTSPQENTNFLPIQSEESETLETDKSLSRDYENYFGLGESKSVTLAEAQNLLRRVESETGIKSAVVYAVFVSESLTPTPAIAQGSAPDNGQSSVWRSQTRSDRDRLELLLLTGEGKTVRKSLNVTRAEVIAVTKQFRLTVTNRRNSRDYLTPAKQMYDWLLAPLEAELQNLGINNLVYITDTGLRTSPLAALHDGKGFAIERYSISLMPSLSLTDPRYSNLGDAQVLAMGASEFSDNRPLPAVPVELATITQTWQGKSFLNSGFTLDNLKQQRALSSYNIIHLATHAEFLPGKPTNSYIQLSDRKLPPIQLPSLGWTKPPVDLLVLSACRTAVGDEQVELGFAGLAVQAGVKSVLASLWGVNDEGTLGLMSEFYQQLKAAPVKAEALRQAQLAMLKGEVRIEGNELVTSEGRLPLPPELARVGDQSLTHPFYWGAFTLIGNPW
ncbi:CHAT domain-containing protein [Microcoleus sp. FACHB-SPT15]|uniref:CHAT domain-containing protein n=1 Tax=Microcoleus sp. FACHB-SPT15 TaxID=2692830 RepID=UPI00177B229F|nr:CHAT domain-containing protein [Microcoleus sp. FACHB-SPT15]MBD1807193.1 CHAT domain-containing protein [Microcoleus sp. FACHB-SPT15]